MTLSIGNHVVKLDQEGKPIMGENASEVHVEYEVVELGTAQTAPGANWQDYDGRVLAVLKKVR